MSQLVVAMDKYGITADTFNRLAQKYQDKYMDFEFYLDTYDKFCQMVTVKQASILELGCGPGNITRYLINRRNDFNIFAIDIAPNMIQLARENVPQAKFLMMDSRDIHFIQQTFDAVMCGFCTPYMDKSDVANLIKELRAKLNKDGVLYLSTMEGGDELSGFQTSDAGDQVYIHYHQLEFLEAHLTANNFEIVATERKQFPAEQGENATDLFIYAKAI